MKTKASLAIFLAATAAFTPLIAAENPPADAKPALTAELRDGSRVVGQSGQSELKFHSQLLGDLKLPITSIRLIEFAGTNGAALTATNGDKFSVQLLDRELDMTTSFGKVALAADSIARLRVSPARRAGRTRAGLVAAWPGDGNAEDVLGVNNGTLNHVTFAPGKIGQAFVFDGLGSTVKIPQSPELNPGVQVTVAFWMKADADNAMENFQGLVTSDFYVFEISSGYGGRMGVNFAVSTTANQPRSRFGFTTSANFAHISEVNGGGCPVSPGQWHHIAGTYDGSRLQLFVDGQPWGSPMLRAGVIAPMLPGSFVAIGSEDGRTTCPDCVSSRYFKGQIDEVQIYNRALPAAEIQEMFAEGN